MPSRVNMPEPPVTSKREASAPASAENGTCKDAMKVLASTRGSESSVVNKCGHIIATRICVPRGHTHAAVPRGQAWPPTALHFPTSHDRPRHLLLSPSPLHPPPDAAPEPPGVIRCQEGPLFS